MAKRKDETPNTKLAREARLASEAALQGKTIDEVRAASTIARRKEESELLAGRVEEAGRRLEAGYQRDKLAGEAVATRLMSTVSPTASPADELGDMQNVIADARMTPTPAKTKLAADTFLSFSFEDVVFAGNPPDRTSRQSLIKLGTLKNLLDSERTDLDETIEKAEPIIRQLAATKRRREAREGAVRAEEDARVADERQREDLKEAMVRKDAVEDRLVQATTGEATNPTVLASLYRQLAELDQAIRELKTPATGEIHEEFQATTERLAAERTPEEQAVFDAARAEATGVPLATGGVGAKTVSELADIAAGAEERPVGPTEAEKNQIRLEIRPQIKAAKTHAAKKELVAEMRARLAGKKTKLMEAKDTIADYDKWASTGVPQSEEMLDLDAEHNTALNKKLERIQKAMPDAQGQQAKSLQKEFEKTKKQLEKNLLAQSKVIETREAAAAAKDKQALDIAKGRFDEAVKRGKQADIDRAQARLDKAETAVQERIDKAEAAVQKRADDERDRMEARAKEERERDDDIRKAKEAQALKKLDVEGKRRNERAKRETDLLKSSYTTALAAHTKAKAALTEFDRNKTLAATQNRTWGAKDKPPWVKKSEEAETGSETKEGTAEHNSKRDASAAAWKDAQSKYKIWVDADDKRIDNIGTQPDIADTEASKAKTATPGEVTQDEIDSLHDEWEVHPTEPTWNQMSKKGEAIFQRMTEEQKASFREKGKQMDAAPSPSKPPKPGTPMDPKAVKEYMAKYGTRERAIAAAKADGWI